MSLFDLSKDAGALTAVLAGIVRHNAAAFLDLVSASSLVHAHASKHAYEICKHAWNLNRTNSMLNYSLPSQKALRSLVCTHLF